MIDIMIIIFIFPVTLVIFACAAVVSMCFIYFVACAGAYCLGASAAVVKNITYWGLRPWKR